MKRLAVVAAVLVVVLGGMTAAAYALSRNPEYRHTAIVRMLGFGCRCNPTRSSSMSLKTLATAQADFRANDRDGNGTQDFWRGDVAGLYTIKDTSGVPNKLIELSMAAADARPVSDLSPYTTTAAKGGYWYKAIRHEGETTPDPQRFAFCAFPECYPETGKWTFILDEGNTVFKKDLGHGRGIEVFPDPDNLLKEGWRRLE